MKSKMNHKSQTPNEDVDATNPTLKFPQQTSTPNQQTNNIHTITLP